MILASEGEIQVASQKAKQWVSEHPFFARRQDVYSKAISEFLLNTEGKTQFKYMAKHQKEDVGDSMMKKSRSENQMSDYIKSVSTGVPVRNNIASIIGAMISEDMSYEIVHGPKNSGKGVESSSSKSNDSSGSSPSGVGE